MIQIDEQKYDKLIVRELKAELKKRNLEPSGRKVSLIKKLLDNDRVNAAARNEQTRRSDPSSYDDPKEYRSSEWVIEGRGEPEEWDDDAMEKNLDNFKDTLVSLSRGFRKRQSWYPQESQLGGPLGSFTFENLPPLKIQVDRYMDEWLRWDRYMTPQDFHHDIFLKIDYPVINVYNVIGVSLLSHFMDGSC